MWDRKIIDVADDKGNIQVLSELCGIERIVVRKAIKLTNRFCLNYVG